MRSTEWRPDMAWVRRKSNLFEWKIKGKLGKAPPHPRKHKAECNNSMVNNWVQNTQRKNKEHNNAMALCKVNRTLLCQTTVTIQMVDCQTHATSKRIQQDHLSPLQTTLYVVRVMARVMVGLSWSSLPWYRNQDRTRLKLLTHGQSYVLVILVVGNEIF